MNSVSSVIFAYLSQPPEEIFIKLILLTTSFVTSSFSSTLWWRLPSCPLNYNLWNDF